MTVKQKRLKLNYEVESNGKQVTKSYGFDIAKNVDKSVAKEVGEVLSTLIKDDIVSYSLTTTEVL
ncbi:hypothetical protein HZY83_02715 [Gemella sp. GH3]|uniref:DUF1659 domain-containing protein n=1 Tax=unclassified Gemella TaxID=2624949 RepID=UPI0015D00C21|nr:MULTISPECIES: hypothetical protein [unclassified Gemella]MBF0713593.1 hypothetical protein [Gemella sp. GH3.1]NYS50545.1 hypothetical protein [Gemella sp. GH3]